MRVEVRGRHRVRVLTRHGEDLARLLGRGDLPSHRPRRIDNVLDKVIVGRDLA